MATVDSLISQLENLANGADLSTRYRISGQLQKLARSIATPRQVLQDIGYKYTDQMVATIAAQLNIFSLLSEAPGALSTNEIAKKCGADAALIERIMRHLASTYTISETGISEYTANDVTRLFASPAGRGMILYAFNITNKIFQELPEFLRSMDYRHPDDSADTAFNRAFDTKEQFFAWLQRDAEALGWFHLHLTTFDSPIHWTSVVPLAQMLQGHSSTPLFVDVGGGHGFQCANFLRATAADFPGRVINQGLPETLTTAPKYENIEMMTQNFYETNKVKGARIYYIRHILHDLPDSNAKLVLKHIREAMSADSILLIDEMVIPDREASLFSAQMDVTMLAFFNSPERTLPQWKTMLREFDLDVRNVYRYDPELEYSILEARPQ